MILSLLLVSFWVALAVLYVARRRVAAVVYLLTLPTFPFSWAPLYIVPFNDLSVLQTVSIGVLLGMVLDTLRELDRRRLRPRELALGALMAAMVVLWSISAFEYSTFSGAVRRLTLNLLDFWVPFVLALRLVDGRGDVLFLLRWLTWPALGVAALAIWEYAVQTPLAWNWYQSVYYSSVAEEYWAPMMRAGVVRVQATLGDAIFLGFYLGCTGLLAFVVANHSSRWPRLAAILAGVLLVVVSFLAMARGAMVGLVVSFALYLVLPGGWVRWRVAVAALAVAGALGLAAGRLEGTGGFWSDFLLTVVGRAPGHVQTEQLQTWEGRLNIVAVGTDVILRGPLLGYSHASAGGWWPIRDVANVFIGIGLVAGPVGLAALLTFLAVLCVRLLQAWQRTVSTSERVLASGLVAAVSIVLVSWMNAPWPGQFAQVGWLLLGIAAAWSGSATVLPSRDAAAGPPPGGRPLRLRTDPRSSVAIDPSVGPRSS